MQVTTVCESSLIVVRVITHRCESYLHLSHWQVRRRLWWLVMLKANWFGWYSFHHFTPLVQTQTIHPLQFPKKTRQQKLLSQSHFTLKKSIFLRRTRINNGFLKWKMKLERDEAEVGEEEVLLGRMYYSKHYWCSDDTHYYYEITGTVKGSAIKILAITQFCLFVPSLLCIFISLG